MIEVCTIVKMKPLLVVLFITLLTVCSTEITIDDDFIQQILDDPQLSDLLDNPEKLRDLLKEQLRSPSKSGSECKVAVKKRHTIIRTRESVAAGAVFLAAPTVHSSKACEDACCANSSCNTAIIKQKSNNTSCYLFDCGSPNVCTFTTNMGFSTIQLYPRNLHISQATRLLSHKHGTKSRSTSTASPSKTTTAWLSTTTVSVASPPNSTQDNEFPSKACKADVDCTGDDNVVCTEDGQCACRIGYHAVGQHCRQDCSRYQFECHNVDRPTVSECIAVYDECDGIVQCSDSSDELSCPHQQGDSKSGPSVVKHHRENVEHLVGNISTTVLSTSTSVNTPSDITDEDGVIKRRIDGQASLQGAFIALCFGVAITLFLVIFAFCRFCRGCSGSRKGRRLNVDGETDYLVNGMYL